MLERLVDEEEAFRTAVARLGRHRVPLLSRVDPYGDTTLRGRMPDEMVRELEAADLTRLNSGEHRVLATLLAWGRRCRADRDLRIAFVGD
ncbi:hypothetical protein [Streptomyces sp. NPDC090112]|uniref:hypothetical protein n=1 Tax=Streptomyces sp. NPDC090112 TaxID=3365949 RepID=UPI0037FB2F5F